TCPRAPARTGRTLGARRDTCSIKLAAISASSHPRSGTPWQTRWPGIGWPIRPILVMRTARGSLRLPAPREVLSGRLRFQAKGCAELGSPFYAELLQLAAADLEAGGAVWELLAGYETESEWSALALRFMGAVHRLVLQDRLPELAPRYPSVGGDG